MQPVKKQRCDEEGFKKIKKEKRPQIIIQESELKPRKAPLSVKDFRELVLWCLSPKFGTNTNWALVKNRGAMTGATVIMLPYVTPHILAFAMAGEDPNAVLPASFSPLERLPMIDSGMYSSLLPFLSSLNPRVYRAIAPGDKTMVQSGLAEIVTVPLAKDVKKAKESSASVQKITLEQCLVTPHQMQVHGYPPYALHAGRQSFESALDREREKTQEVALTDLEFMTLPAPSSTQRYRAVALDCEMCYTELGLECARISVVDASALFDLSADQSNSSNNEKQRKSDQEPLVNEMEKYPIIYDTLLKPQRPILDYNTRFSGITMESFDSCQETLVTVRERLSQLLDANTILIGHGLENDLHSLGLVHHRVIDTSLLYDHARGAPYKPALRWLADRHLRIGIQQDKLGHNPIEDARAAARLVALKLLRGRLYGSRAPLLKSLTLERGSSLAALGALGARVSLFAQLEADNCETTCVDHSIFAEMYATPQTKVVIMEPHELDIADKVKQNLPSTLEKKQFLWMRMMHLERLLRPKSEDDETLTSVTVTREQIRTTLRQLDQQCQQLVESLPGGTLVMAITGQGDARAFTQLLQERRQSQRKAASQAQQAAQLELELQRAAEVARDGFCWMGISK